MPLTGKEQGSPGFSKEKLTAPEAGWPCKRGPRPHKKPRLEFDQPPRVLLHLARLADGGSILWWWWWF